MEGFWIVGGGAVLAGIFFWLGRRNVHKNHPYVAEQPQERLIEERQKRVEQVQQEKKQLKRTALVGRYGTQHYPSGGRDSIFTACGKRMSDMLLTKNPGDIKGQCLRCWYVKGWD